jgi:hypothetical protein
MEGIECDTKYHGTVAGLTFTAFTLKPTFTACRTTNGTAVTGQPHDCVYQFTSRAEPTTKHATLHLNCGAGKGITLTHNNCTISIQPQTLSGVSYKPTQWLGTESLTVEFTITNAKYTQHNGACALLGTTREDGKLTGGLIVKAWEEGKAPIVGANIKAT